MRQMFPQVVQSLDLHPSVLMRGNRELPEAQVEFGCRWIMGGIERVTVRIGVCAYDQAATESADDLVARADAVLYRAKNAGRNRVE